MKAKLRLLVVVVCCLSGCSNKPESFEDRLQEVLDEGIKEFNVRGVSAAIIFEGDSIWTGVSGVSHDTVVMKSDMLFAIGSVTKNVMAALALKLAEHHILSLEDPLSKWLPPYNHVDGNITILQLLNHTSGLYMYWDNDDLWEALKADRSRVWTPEEVLTYIGKPKFSPGEGWGYSNTNYLLLAMIIIRATESSLSSDLQQYFWEPLGIKNAYFSLEDTIPENQAHIFGDDLHFGDAATDVTFLPRASHESITHGSSGLFLTAKDLARWCYMLYDWEVLEQQSLDQMLQFEEFDPFANMNAYGLGVQVFTKAFSSGKYAIGHGGANIGTGTYMVYLPEYRVSIVVMVNAFPSESITVITKGLIRTVLKEQNAIGIIPYINFFPTGVLIIALFVMVFSALAFHIRKRRKMDQK